MKKLIIAGLLLVNGCASFSTFQTADTLPPDTFLIGFGSSRGSMKFTPQEQLTDHWYATVLLDLIGRYGLTEDIDVGIRFVPVSFFEGDVKYQLYKETDNLLPSLSVGFGTSYGGYSRPNFSLSAFETFVQDNDNIEIFNLFIPVYISKHLSPSFQIYTAGKLQFSHIFLHEKPVAGISSETINEFLPGITLGLAYDINPNWSIMGEYSYFWSGYEKRNSISNLGFAFVCRPWVEVGDSVPLVANEDQAVP